jgi:hypothetical protein
LMNVLLLNVIMMCVIQLSILLLNVTAHTSCFSIYDVKTF